MYGHNTGKNLRTSIRRRVKTLVEDMASDQVEILPVRKIPTADGENHLCQMWNQRIATDTKDEAGTTNKNKTNTCGTMESEDGKP